MSSPLGVDLVFTCEAVRLQLQGADLLLNHSRTEVERYLFAERFVEARSVRETSLMLTKAESFCWGGIDLPVNIHCFLPGELGWVGRRGGTVPLGLWLLLSATGC